MDYSKFALQNQYTSAKLAPKDESECNFCPLMHLARCKQTILIAEHMDEFNILASKFNIFAIKNRPIGRCTSPDFSITLMSEKYGKRAIGRFLNGIVYSVKRVFVREGDVIEGRNPGRRGGRPIYGAGFF